MYNAVDVAHYVIMHENELNRPISNLRLGKLLYFIQAQFLVSKNAACFDEDIVAWDFGPVVLEVYDEFKIYGSLQISHFNTEKALSVARRDRHGIDIMLDTLSNYSTNDLLKIIKKQKPWRDAYLRPFDNRVSNETLKECFML